MTSTELVVRRRRSALGSAAFMVAGPGTVAGLVPWLLTRWKPRDPVPGGVAAQAAGAVLVGAAAATLTGAFVRFVREGIGTPMPVAAPTELVLGGLYRYVRNPMYVALGAGVLGQALVLGRGRLVAYVAGMSVPVVTFVRLREEPVLHRRFGQQYDEYRANVPGWIPRLSPWQGPPVVAR